MRSKTSFFNKTLFFKNITRFWPVWTLYLVYLFFSMPLTLLLTIRDAPVPQDQTICLLQCVQMNLRPASAFLFAVLCALAVFSYLYSARSCNMIHAFPVRREELFFTNYISGLLFLAVPQVLMFLASLLICVSGHVASAEYLLVWLLFVMGMSFFFYSMAVFFCMLTGNPFAAAVYYVIWNFLYVGFKELFLGIAGFLCYGLVPGFDGTTADTALSPFYFLAERVNLSWSGDGTAPISDIRISGGRTVAVYAAAGIVLMILALLLYRRRQLECAGDILSFRWLKPMFRWMAAFGAGCGFAMLFSLAFFEDSPAGAAVLKVCSIGFSLVFFFVAEMLIRKKFRVFSQKRWIEAAVCAASVFFVLTAIDADLFGAERRVPRTEDVQAVRLNAVYDIVDTEPEEIDRIREIHQSAVEHKKEYEQLGSEGSAETGYIVEICYYLKNGRQLSREYTIPMTEETLADPDATAAKIAARQADPDTYMEYLFCRNYENARFFTGTLYWTGSYDDRELTETGAEKMYGNPSQGYTDDRKLTQTQAQALFEAFSRDVAEGNYPYGVKAFLPHGAYCNRVYIEGNVEEKAERIYDSIPENFNFILDTVSASLFPARNLSEDKTNESVVSADFQVFQDCRHTIRALIDTGVIADESELIPEEAKDAD